MAKSTKAEANYREHPQGKNRCRDCTMFRQPRSCTAVEGDISPGGVCKFFKRKKHKHDVSGAVGTARHYS